MERALRSASPEATTGERRTRAIQLVMAFGIPLAFTVGLVAVLWQPFDPIRLAIKSGVPFAVLLPTTLLVPSRVRGVAAAALVLPTMALVTWVCLAVFGVRANWDILLPLLALTQLHPSSLLLALGLLGMIIAVRRWSGHAFAPWGSVADLLIGAGEAIYFGGFLLASTATLGLWSWGLIWTGLVLSAKVRQVPLWRAVAGASAFVGAMVWSGSPYSAFLTHIALLGGPKARSQPRAGLGRPRLRSSLNMTMLSRSSLHALRSYGPR